MRPRLLMLAAAIALTCGAQQKSRSWGRGQPERDVSSGSRSGFPPREREGHLRPGNLGAELPLSRRDLLYIRQREARQRAKTEDRLQVWRDGKEIRDPSTGKLLLRDDTLLGEAVVTIVNDISSIAEYKGAEKPKVGDLVNSIPKQ